MTGPTPKTSRVFGAGLSARPGVDALSQAEVQAALVAEAKASRVARPSGDLVSVCVCADVAALLMLVCAHDGRTPSAFFADAICARAEAIGVAGLADVAALSGMSGQARNHDDGEKP